MIFHINCKTVKTCYFFTVYYTAMPCFVTLNLLSFESESQMFNISIYCLLLPHVGLPVEPLCCSLRVKVGVSVHAGGLTNQVTKLVASRCWGCVQVVLMASVWLQLLCLSAVAQLSIFPRSIFARAARQIHGKCIWMHILISNWKEFEGLSIMFGNCTKLEKIL